ncbi:MAG: hypothetical protein K2O34_13305 [Acetatifactor sp.]|nr:hypothetical protein [Acetatifactor sp.]
MTRRIRMVGILAAMLLVLSGCGLEGIFSDAGTDVANTLDASRYLDLSVLSGEGNTGDDWNSYSVYTLSYGVFSTQMVSLRANMRMLETACVKAEYRTGTMRLTELLVDKYQYIAAGTPVAAVSMEVDDMDIQEMERRLLRLQQRYAAAQEEFLENQEEREAQFARWDPQRSIDITRYNQAQLDFEQTAISYERQIADLQEQIAELKKLAGQTQILAEQDGYVLDIALLQRGQKLENGTVLIMLASADKICLEFADQLEHYGYGNQVTLQAGEAWQNKNYDAMVISAVSKSLSSDWDLTVSRLAGDYDIAELLGNGPFNVSGETSVMENVLLVPAEAVTVEKQKYYVTVLGDDGSMTKTQFIPGGSNTDYYWVFDGLEEGARIVVP